MLSSKIDQIIYMNKHKLIKQARELDKEAKSVLKDTNLIKLLSKHGKVEIVGSLALGLLVWRDIDIDVVMDKSFDTDKYFQTVMKLFRHKNIKDLRLIDNRTSFESNRPKSMYIGVFYQKHGSEKWKIDIRFVHIKDAYALDYLNEIRSKLDEKNRLNILKIKEAVYTHPLYGKEFSSVDIYSAVLDKGITTKKEFFRYIQLSK